MENDGFLEFKWKGDQFLIFSVRAAFASARSSDFTATLPFIFYYFGAAVGGRQVSLEWKEERQRPSALWSPKKNGPHQQKASV